MKKLILPGLVDVHVHLREPGQEEKEDFYTGTSAALAGGFTKVLDMPNNTTPVFTAKDLLDKMHLAKKKIVCDVGFYFGSLGDNFREFKTVENLVFGLKIYLNKTTGNYQIDVSKFDKLIARWPGTRPILVHSEIDTIDSVISAVKKTRKKVHFCHLSSQDELARIIRAKNQGLPVTCGVTPHHLFLNQKDARALGPFGLMKPEIKTEKDRQFLWKNIQYIDVIESDHAPHPISEKRSKKPPFGAPGLETTLPLLLTAYADGMISLERIIELCFSNPCKLFGLVEDSGTRVEVELGREVTIRNRDLKTKCGWSPFNGRKVKAKVRRVFIRGKPVFNDGKILAKPGFGEVLIPV